MTTAVDPHRYVLRNYCRKECNVLGDPDGGHMERHAGGPWMLAADVLPVLEELRRTLTASGEALKRYGWHGGGSPMCERVKGDSYPCTCGLDAALEKANGR